MPCQVEDHDVLYIFSNQVPDNVQTKSGACEGQTKGSKADLLYICPGGLTKGRDGVDGGYSLSQESICS